MKRLSFRFIAVQFLAYKFAGYSETAGRALDEFAFLSPLCIVYHMIYF